MWRVLRWTLATVLLVVLLSVVSIATIIATEPGTRWLIARAAPYLPAELQISGVSGTLLRGLGADQVRWSDDAAVIIANGTRIRVELLPLLQRQVIINTFDVERVAVTVTGRQQSAASDDPFLVDLPVDISVDSASIRNIEIQVGETRQLIDRIDVGARLAGPDLDVSRLVLQSRVGNLDISGSLTLTDELAANLQASWRLTMPELPQSAGELTVSGNVSEYQFRHVLNEPQQIQSRGSISLVNDFVTGNIVSEWQLLEVTLADGRRIQSADGQLQLDGSVDQFNFDAATTVRIDQYPELLVRFSGEGDPGGARFAEFRLEGEPGIVTASGDFSVDPGPAVEVRIDELVGEVNGYAIDGAVTATWREGEFGLTSAHVRLGENEIDASGVFGEAVSLDASLRLSNLAELHPEAGGSLAGDLELRRSDEDYSVAGNLAGSSLSWSDYAVGSLTTGIDLSASQSSSLSVMLEDVAIGAVPIESATIGLQGSMDAHDVRADIGTTGGQLNFEATGGYRESGWTGMVETLSVSGIELGEWSLQQAVSLSVAPSVVQVERACLVDSRTDASGCFAASHESGAATIFDLHIEALPLVALPLTLPEGADISGSVIVRANGEIKDQLLTGSGEISLEEFGLSADYEGDEISMDFETATVHGSIADNRLDANLQLQSVERSTTAAAQITVADILNDDSVIDGTGSLEFTDLSLLAILFPAVSSPTGAIGGSFDLGGSLAAPVFAGEIALVDGAFDVRRAGISLTDVQLSVQQHEAGALSLDGSAVSGEGRLVVKGLTTLEPGSGIRTSIDIEGQDFALMQLPDWLVTASPSISILLDDNATRVSGELIVPTANISVRSLPATSVRPSPDVVVRRSEEVPEMPRRVLSIDVNAALGDDVELSGFGLTTGLEGTIRIQGGSNRPYVGNGRLTLRDGEYTAYGQDLEIEQGDLIFNGPLSRPSLDIRARRRLPDVVAGVHLTGTPADLRSELYSDPSMSDAEVLSYLLTGRPLATATAGEGDLLNDAAFSLGLAAAGGIASQIGTELGLDTLAIEGGTSDGQLVAGKRLNDRVQVEYAYGIIDKLGMLVIRYDLTSRLLLETRSGATHTLDLIYKVRLR